MEFHVLKTLLFIAKVTRFFVTYLLGEIVKVEGRGTSRTLFRAFSYYNLSDVERIKKILTLYYGMSKGAMASQFPGDDKN